MSETTNVPQFWCAANTKTPRCREQCAICRSLCDESASRKSPPIPAVPPSSPAPAAPEPDAPLTEQEARTYRATLAIAEGSNGAKLLAEYVRRVRVVPVSPEQATEGTQWSTHDTAPKDGRHILVTDKGRGGFGTCGGERQDWCAVVHYWSNPGEEGFYLSSGADDNPKPFTHWMPLPPHALPLRSIDEIDIARELTEGMPALNARVAELEKAKHVSADLLRQIVRAPAPEREASGEEQKLIVYARTAIEDVCRIIERGDERLLASDGPCGGQPPDIDLAEWRTLYVTLDNARKRLWKYAASPPSGGSRDGTGHA